MKILFTNTGPWGTGSFTMLEATTKSLIKMGHEVKIIFPDSDLPHEHELQHSDFKNIYEITKFPVTDGNIRLDTFPLLLTDPHPRNPHPLFFKTMSQAELDLYYKTIENHFLQVYKSFQPDIIECQHIWSTAYYIQKLGYPIISTAHHSDQLAFHYDKRMQPIAKEAAQQAEYLFAISEFVKDEVIELYDVPENKVITIPNGYDNATFTKQNINAKEFLHEFSIEHDTTAKYITFAGKLSKTKGIDILLEANSYLSAEENIHFLIFGAGEIEPTLTKNKDLYCFDRIHLMGHCNPKTLAAAHNIAHLCVLPSRSEGFGIACLEAMGCGIPLVVTNTGGMPSYAVGEVIDANNPESLTKAIRSICNLPEKQYKALCQESHKKAQEYDWDQITKTRVNYYEKVIRINKKTSAL